MTGTTSGNVQGQRKRQSKRKGNQTQLVMTRERNNHININTKIIPTPRAPNSNEPSLVTTSHDISLPLLPTRVPARKGTLFPKFAEVTPNGSSLGYLPFPPFLPKQSTSISGQKQGGNNGHLFDTAFGRLLYNHPKKPPSSSSPASEHV